MTGRRVFAGFLRYGIGLVLLATSIGKLLDLRGFARVLGTYDVFSAPFLAPLSVAVSALELALAVWLFSGRLLARAAAASAVLNGAYAVWAAVGMARGLRIPNCGCFGVFLARPLTWGTVAEDLLMTAGSVALHRLSLAARRPS